MEMKQTLHGRLVTSQPVYDIRVILQEAESEDKRENDFLSARQFNCPDDRHGQHEDQEVRDFPSQPSGNNQSSIKHPLTHMQPCIRPPNRLRMAVFLSCVTKIPVRMQGDARRERA
jgi:hypothetical protein